MFVWKYAHDTQRARIEWFLKLRKEFREKKKFDPIFDFLDLPSPTNQQERNAAAKQIKSITALKSDRYEFAAFLDDVAMCVNAGVIQSDVANY